MKTCISFSFLFLWLSGILYSQQVTITFPILTGDYLGQKKPEMTSTIFAPNIVSTCLEELNSVFYPDGNEFYFSVHNPDFSTVFVIIKDKGSWNKPEPLSFTSKYSDIDVSVSPDGQTLFFCSNRPISGKGEPKKDHDIWFCKREANSWGKPIPLGEEINSDKEDFYPVVSKNGTLYFNSQREGEGTNDIYMSKFIDGKYSKAEKLNKAINSEYREFDAYIEPDEKFIIFASDRPENNGRGDLYISFKNEDGTWAAAKNMGTTINGVGPEFSPYLSPDGKYLFYTRQTWTPITDIKEPLTYDYFIRAHNSYDNLSTNIWWIDSKIIEELKK